jgi:hypothetical protein
LIHDELEGKPMKPAKIFKTTQTRRSALRKLGLAVAFGYATPTLLSASKATAGAKLKKRYASRCGNSISKGNSISIGNSSCSSPDSLRKRHGKRRNQNGGNSGNSVHGGNSGNSVHGGNSGNSVHGGNSGNSGGHGGNSGHGGNGGNGGHGGNGGNGGHGGHGGNSGGGGNSGNS